MAKGGNQYHKWGPEQRKNWNKYSTNYARTHFKSLNLKLRIVEDKDIIDYLERNATNSVSELVRKIIREKIENENK